MSDYYNDHGPYYGSMPQKPQNPRPARPGMGIHPVNPGVRPPMYVGRPNVGIMPVRPPDTYTGPHSGNNFDPYHQALGQLQEGLPSGDPSLYGKHNQMQQSMHPSFSGNPMAQAMQAAKWYKQQQMVQGS